MFVYSNLVTIAKAGSNISDGCEIQALSSTTAELVCPRVPASCLALVMNSSVFYQGDC